MYYKGNKQRCEDYNAIVSYGQAYKDENTTKWTEITERGGDFYVLKHPDYEGTFLTEVENLPELPMYEM